ncbi:MAG TPA: SAM hydroxide adenosyltransferase [Patescibacteria group bacterium]|nr:SAM hydroxide adenosyltransferase [Patescibacteria group bacterium]
MFTTIITDCTDANVEGRLGTRVASLFGVTPTFVGVGNNLQTNNAQDPAEYEAAGCLIDVLDASEGEGVILVNVANRHGKGKKWPNGTPFGSFYVGKQLVVATIDGYCLSFIKKLHLASEIQIFDIPTVTASLVQQHILTPELAQRINHTQFRSFEFQPRVAKWLTDGLTLPTQSYSLAQVEALPESIWYIDNFGNCKTTLLPEDIGFTQGKTIPTKLGELMCFARMKDVPNGQPGLIIGSSGYGEKRFLEVIVQGVSAAKKFHLSVGSTIL